jgi:hypothetical protein
MQTPSPDPIPSLWQQREQLRPLLVRYGAWVFGKAIAQFRGLEHSRTGCHQLATLMMALTDFQKWFDYADVYLYFGSTGSSRCSLVEELRVMHLFPREDED